MVRLIIVSVVVVVAAAFAAVEARVINPIVAPSNLTSPLDAVADNGRKMTGADECAWTCEHVRNKRMCHTLRKLPGVSSPRELLSAAVKVSMGKAQAAEAKFAAAQAAAAQRGEGEPMDSILDTCAKAYGEMAAALQETQRCIDASGSVANLVTKMSSASTFAGDCGDAFDERGVEHMFPAVQRNVQRVVSSTLGIAAKLKQ